jgi:hypothetical protein
MTRRPYEVYDDDVDTDDNRKSTLRDLDRKQQRKIKTALKTKDLRYILDLEDDEY